MTEPCPAASAQAPPAAGAAARRDLGALDVAYAQFRAGFLLRLPPDIAASFDERQIFVIWQAFGPWQGRERRRGWHMRLRLPRRSLDVSIRPAAPGEEARLVSGLAFLAGAILGAALAYTLLVLIG